MIDNWKEITDPEELFKLKSEGWEIEIQYDPGNDKYCPFIKWDGRRWNIGYLFRARHRQPKMKKVKLWGWWDGEQYFRLMEDVEPKWSAIRLPSKDEEIEVPE